MYENLNIDETINEFLQHCLTKGFSKRTVESYHSSLRIWLSFINRRGITNLTEINRDILLEYSQYLQSSYRSNKGLPLAVSTQAQKLTALKTYISYCARIGKVLLNPAEDIPMPKLPKPLPRGIITKQQMKKLLKRPDTSTNTGFRDRVILELLYSTGVRRNELVSIHTRDCQLSERRLFIRNGKGGKQRWLPLGKKICTILQEYLSQIRPQLLKDKSHDMLIVGDKGDPMKGPRVYTIVSRYLKQLGIKSDCHGIRHSCATHLLKGKANIRVIQELLGHTSLSSTQIYTHVDISDMAKAIEKAHPRENMSCEDY